MLSQIHFDHLWYGNLCDQGMPRLNIISGCVCEGVCRWDYHLNQWLSKVNYPPQCVWTSPNTVRAWLDKKEERISPFPPPPHPCLTVWAGAFHFIFSRPWNEIYTIISPDMCRYKYRYGHRYTPLYMCVCVCVYIYIYIYIYDAEDEMVRITNSVEVNLRKLQERVKDRGAWWAAVCGSQRIGHDWVTEQQYM